ncbi:MAG: DUF4340 domain-containing protein [Desulfovibrionales bacterium]|nr:DUF4340 domain-containing protein [Desulfovibrionales bacterium]
MNARSIVVLALILALLGAGLWYRRTFRDDARVMTSESLRPMVPADLNTTALDRIEISRPGSAAVILEKTDGSWRIPALGGVMASAQGVEHMLAAVGGLRGELRSSDPAVLRDFELESEQALGLVLHQGQTELAHLLFGKGDFRQVFVRAAGSSDVCVVPGTILGQLGAHGSSLSAQFWIDTNLLSVPATEVAELRLSTPTDEAILIRTTQVKGNTGNAASAWTLRQSRGKGLPLGQLEDIVPALARVSVFEAVPPGNALVSRLNTPTHRLEIRTPSRTLVLEAALHRDDILVRRADSSHVYRMHATVFRRLFPAPPNPAG